MAAVEYSLLIIDTDEQFCRQVVDFFTAINKPCYAATLGIEALDIYYQKHPDVIICDIEELSADESVYAAISELVNLTPLIALSLDKTVDGVLQALRFGASDFLQKPLADFTGLQHAAENCFERGKVRHQHYAYRQQLEESNQQLKDNLALLKQDQKAGRQVQFKMLPDTPKRFANYTFRHRIFPSLYLSGDFIDYFSVGEQHVVFFIADVSGHGASSAFVTVLLKNLFARKRSDHIHRKDDDILSPVAMMKQANKVIVDTDVDKHLTMCMGVINLDTGELNYGNAGHLPQPLLVTEGKSEYLPGEGMPVGLFAEPEFEEKQLFLPENFVLTLFSDGILEILARDGLKAQEAFMLERLQAAPLTVEGVSNCLGLQKVGAIPDDIAVLIITNMPD